MTLSREICAEITSVLRDAGRSDLAEEVEAAFQPIDALTSSEAANILGVSAQNTVKNWLKGGMFPGAFQTEGGHWRFRREEVEKGHARMEELHDKNERRDVEPTEVDNPQDPPLL